MRAFVFKILKSTKCRFTLCHMGCTPTVGCLLKEIK
jgi:hypothetical protein